MNSSTNIDPDTDHPSAIYLRSAQEVGYLRSAREVCTFSSWATESRAAICRELNRPAAPQKNEKPRCRNLCVKRGHSHACMLDSAQQSMVRLVYAAPCDTRCLRFDCRRRDVFVQLSTAHRAVAARCGEAVESTRWRHAPSKSGCTERRLDRAQSRPVVSAAPSSTWFSTGSGSGQTRVSARIGRSSRQQ